MDWHQLKEHNYREFQVEARTQQQRERDGTLYHNTMRKNTQDRQHDYNEFVGREMLKTQPWDPGPIIQEAQAARDVQRPRYAEACLGPFELERLIDERLQGEEPVCRREGIDTPTSTS